MRDPIIVAVAIFASVLLYWMRSRHRFAYGIVELIFGLFVIVISAFSHMAPSDFAQTQRPFEPLPTLGAIAAGVYIIVRGLDNISIALPKRWRRSWEAIFGSSHACR
jgi:hypothetical protein